MHMMEKIQLGGARKKVFNTSCPEGGVEGKNYQGQTTASRGEREARGPSGKRSKRKSGKPTQVLVEEARNAPSVPGRNIQYSLATDSQRVSESPKKGI